MVFTLFLVCVHFLGFGEFPSSTQFSAGGLAVNLIFLNEHIKKALCDVIITMNHRRFVFFFSIFGKSG